MRSPFLRQNNVVHALDGPTMPGQTPGNEGNCRSAATLACSCTTVGARARGSCERNGKVLRCHGICREPDPLHGQLVRSMAALRGRQPPQAELDQYQQHSSFSLQSARELLACGLDIPYRCFVGVGPSVCRAGHHRQLAGGLRAHPVSGIDLTARFDQCSKLLINQALTTRRW